MNEIIKNEIKLLCESFDTTQNIYEKGYICTVINYLADNNPNDQDIINMRNDIRAKLSLLSNEYLDFLLTRRESMIYFMRNNIDEFDKRIAVVNKNEDYYHDELPKLSNENIDYIIELFLGRLDKKILEFYKKMKSEGRILHGNENNIAHISLYLPKTLVFIQNLSNIRDIYIFLHELAHAYYIYINSYLVRERENLRVELKDEIPSKIMEYKFIEFVEKNCYGNQYLALKNSFDSVMYNCYEKRDHYEHLKYLIASDIALSIGDRKFNITRYFKHVYNKDVLYLMDEANSKKRIGKVLRK